jgi:hypothetical protein
LLNVTQGGSAHAAYTYDPDNLLLLTENLSRSTNPNRLITRKYDDYLRATGYKLGTTADDDLYAQTTYGYDAAGRAETFTYLRTPEGGGTSSPHQFTYDYEDSSRGLISTLTGPTHTVTNT